jgi:hypothetical protein
MRGMGTHVEFIADHKWNNWVEHIICARLLMEFWHQDPSILSPSSKWGCLKAWLLNVMLFMKYILFLAVHML